MAEPYVPSTYPRSMPRPPRLLVPGALYHVTTHGVANTEVFEGDSDRGLFVVVLGSVIIGFGWVCHAYCLMGNHFHLLVETPMPNLSDGMQRLNSVYAQTFNRVRGRSGHLFKARFHAVVIERESHLLEAARYVVLNPVRARICSHPGDWSWSSYRATAGLEPPSGFLTVDWLLGQLSPVRPEAVERYRRFVDEGAARPAFLTPAVRVFGGFGLAGRVDPPARGLFPPSGGAG